MTHLYKMSEWQDANERWLCNDVSELAGIGSNWWVPARLMGITPAEYINKVITEYKPDFYCWTGKIFIFSWAKENYSRCHKFMLDINLLARKKNFIV